MVMSHISSMTDTHVSMKLRSLRERAGLSMDAMAKALGFRGPSSYQRYENPDLFTKSALPNHLTGKIGHVLIGKGAPPISEAEILELTGITPLSEGPIPFQVATPKGNSTDLPIYGDAGGLSDGVVLNHGNAYAHTARPEIFSRNSAAFAVYNNGSLMQPRYFQGELLLIDPVKPPQITDFILLERHDGIAIVRQLIDIKNDDFYVAQFNPDKEYSIPKDEVKRIYRIAGAYDV